MFLLLDNADYIPSSQTVTLSAEQPRDCITVTIVDDSVIDEGEVLGVSLLTLSPDVSTVQGITTAMVLIVDNDEGSSFMKFTLFTFCEI